MGSEKPKGQGGEAAGFMRSSDDVEEPRKIHVDRNRHRLRM